MSEFTPLMPLIRGASEVKTLEFFGARLSLLITGHDTEGQWCLLDYTAPPNYAGPPLHWHKEIRELFYVLEGRLTIRLDQDTKELSPGELALVPPGVVHSFTNPTEEPVRFLIHLTPAGFEEYFIGLAELVQKSPTWPPEDRSELIALSGRFDQYPPPAPR
jgi:mannose-6-phosphate isomerase-like protein (cupin superfamily)